MRAERLHLVSYRKLPKHILCFTVWSAIFQIHLKIGRTSVIFKNIIQWNTMRRVCTSVCEWSNHLRIIFWVRVTIYLLYLVPYSVHSGIPVTTDQITVRTGLISPELSTWWETWAALRGWVHTGISSPMELSSHSQWQTPRYIKASGFHFYKNDSYSFPWIFYLNKTSPQNGPVLLSL